LLSFRGISTPSLPAQGEQRRSSYFNIPRGNSRAPSISGKDIRPNRGPSPCPPVCIPPKIARTTTYPSAEYRLPASLHFAESDAIGGVVSARSVHKVGYGHKAQTKTSIC
jgi:hypothetical protein